MNNDEIQEFIGKNIKDLTEEQINELCDSELNACDKCGIIESTYDLVWITAEDFEPKENEIVPDELYKEHDVLCEGCYFKEITIKKDKLEG